MTAAARITTDQVSRARDLVAPKIKLHLVADPGQGRYEPGAIDLLALSHLEPEEIVYALPGPAAGAAIEQAVADLRYGSIGVNLWHAMSFAFSTTVWGAYPGHPITDIQSGSGFVGNAYMFARPQKSVVRGPFRATPAPAWFATNRNASEVMRKFLSFEAAPSWRKLPGLLLSALKK